MLEECRQSTLETLARCWEPMLVRISLHQIYISGQRWHLTYFCPTLAINVWSTLLAYCKTTLATIYCPTLLPIYSLTLVTNHKPALVTTAIQRWWLCDVTTLSFIIGSDFVLTRLVGFRFSHFHFSMTSKHNRPHFNNNLLVRLWFYLW